MERHRVTIGPQGRLVVPAPLRKELDLEPGDVLVARAEEGRLVLETKDAILERWRKHFAAIAPPGVSMVDKLIAERREEARRAEEEIARALERREEARRDEEKTAKALERQ